MILSRIRSPFTPFYQSCSSKVILHQWTFRSFTQDRNTDSIKELHHKDTQLQSPIDPETLKDRNQNIEVLRDFGIKPAYDKYSILIESTLKKNEIEKAISIFDTLKKEGVQVNQTFYNTLLHKLLRRDKNSVSFIFDQMVKDSIQLPSIEDYTVIMAYYYNREDYERVYLVYDELRRYYRGDRRSFEILVNMESKRHNMEGIRSILVDLRQSGLKMDEKSFSPMIRMFVKIQDYNSLLKLLIYMKECDITITSITYSYYIRVFAELGRLEECLEWYSTMLTQGMQIDTQIYEMMLFAYEKSGRLDLIDVFLNNVGDYKPNIEFYTTLMRIYLSNRQEKKAIEILRKIELNGFEWTLRVIRTITYSITPGKPSKWSIESFTLLQTLRDQLNQDIKKDIDTEKRKLFTELAHILYTLYNIE